MAVVYKVNPNPVAKDADIDVVAWLGATGVVAGNVAVRMSKNKGASSPVAFSLVEIGDDQYWITVGSAVNDTAGPANLFVSGVSGQTAIDLKVETNAKTPGEVYADINSGTVVVTPKDASITAAKIATDAIDADALKADAATEIANAVWLPGNVQAIWDVLTSALTTPGSIGKLLVDNIDETLSTIDTVVDAIKAKTDGLNFTGANVDSTPQTNVTVASASEDSIVDKVFDEAVADHVSAGTIGKYIQLIGGYIFGKRSITGSGLSRTEKVYDTDGVTLLSTHTVTFDASDNVTDRSERS